MGLTAWTRRLRARRAALPSLLFAVLVLAAAASLPTAAPAPAQTHAQTHALRS